MAITGPDPLTAARPDQPDRKDPAAAALGRRLLGGALGQPEREGRSRSSSGSRCSARSSSILGLVPYDPQYEDPAANLVGPNAHHWLGTDNFGRDMLSLVLEGILVSLEIAVIATLIAGVFGSIGGIVAGYLGGIDLDADHARAATSSSRSRRSCSRWRS